MGWRLVPSWPGDSKIQTTWYAATPRRTASASAKRTSAPGFYFDRMASTGTCPGAPVNSGRKLVKRWRLKAEEGVSHD